MVLEDMTAVLQGQRRQQGALLLVFCSCALAALSPRCASGQSQDIPAAALYFYAGDAYFLNSWGLGFVNMPLWFWNAKGGPPCEAGGYVGISCSAQGYVTAIDLSPGGGGQGRSSGVVLRGSFLPDVAGLLFLQTLNVAGNKISGLLPAELCLAPSLSTLNVEGNSLTGPLPECLGQLSSLHCLHLADNNFTGQIPSNWSHFPCADFAGNHLNITPGVTCQDVPSKSCSLDTELVYAPPPPLGPPVANVAALVGGIVGGLVFLTLLLAALMLFLKHLQRQRKREAARRLAEDIEAQISTRHFGTLRRFTVAELKEATGQFDEDNILGEGGFSIVYKGALPLPQPQDQQPEQPKLVAVKRIKEERRRVGGELEFLNEVEAISRAVHKNLMHAEGFCVEAGECMLVLPFYSNGSLASRTQGKEGDPLDWGVRQKIAQGAAEGIAYLHTDCSPKLIHRDIKAANVLLDDEHEAIIADFGLAKEMDVKESHATTAIKGTIGHIAPEYFVSGQCSEKTDVYAFGVLLMELVSGKDVYQLSVPAEEGDMLLRDWVCKALEEGRVGDVVDAELQLEGEEAGSRAQVVKVLQVALLCLQNEPGARPNMDEVAKLLSGSGLAEKWQKWQAEAGILKAEDLLEIINTPGIWNNLSTGVSLDGFGVQGPR